mgnify:CR=1 FL=1
MGKFEEVFEEPVYFSNGAYILNGNYSPEEAAIRFSDYIDEDIKPHMLHRDVVRYGFPPENVEDREAFCSCWYTGAKGGRGSKQVWVYS